jgi:hypothetical protein
MGLLVVLLLEIKLSLDLVVKGSNYCYSVGSTAVLSVKGFSIILNLEVLFLFGSYSAVVMPVRFISSRFYELFLFELAADIIAVFLSPTCFVM